MKYNFEYTPIKSFVGPTLSPTDKLKITDTSNETLVKVTDLYDSLTNREKIECLSSLLHWISKEFDKIK